MNFEKEREPAVMAETFNAKEEMVPQIILVDDLGENNDGKLGPIGLSTEFVEQAVEDTANPEYHKKACHCFVCVDGRPVVGGDQLPELSEGEAYPAIAGGLAISLGSARMMMSDSPKPLSETTAQTTHDAISAGYPVVMHDHCGANINQRAVLERNKANVDIVAPKVWALAEATGLTAMTHGVDEPLIDKDDVVSLIMQGGANAENGEVWDVDADGNTEVARQNGALYINLGGEHLEILAGVTTGEDDVFDNQAYARDHKHPETGEDIQAFTASLGAAQKAVFDITEKTGGTMRDAALLTLGVFAVTVGTTKKLKNDDLKAVVFAK
jgi:hypothetical protein